MPDNFANTLLSLVGLLVMLTNVESCSVQPSGMENAAATITASSVHSSCSTEKALLNSEEEPSGVPSAAAWCADSVNPSGQWLQYDHAMFVVCSCPACLSSMYREEATISIDGETMLAPSLFLVTQPWRVARCCMYASSGFTEYCPTSVARHVITSCLYINTATSHLYVCTITFSGITRRTGNTPPVETWPVEMRAGKMPPVEKPTFAPRSIAFHDNYRGKGTTFHRYISGRPTRPVLQPTPSTIAQRFSWMVTYAGTTVSAPENSSSVSRVTLGQRAEFSVRTTALCVMGGAKERPAEGQAFLYLKLNGEVCFLIGSS
ncbi:hypothetical protein Bbelb_272270 [Branchiostoma belcheri]|nr:hypothetical protein Bbelb_272270 [Branchiostoma belcheri]